MGLLFYFHETTVVRSPILHEYLLLHAHFPGTFFAQSMRNNCLIDKILWLFFTKFKRLQHLISYSVFSSMASFLGVLVSDDNILDVSKTCPTEIVDKINKALSEANYPIQKASSST